MAQILVDDALTLVQPAYFSLDSLMASSSTSSSVHKSFKYDVFLSFRGEDTRKNFVDHLYSALQQKGIHTYKDDERINKGKRISDELMGSIEDSKFYIIVFSKTYASSSWCLDELVKIMECHKTTEHTAYPVFYDVEPSEVRKQSGAVKEAFSKHEKEEAAGKWREALKEAASLAGWELKNTANGHEAKFIQKIVEKLSLEVRSINFSIQDKLVGMESRIEDVVSSLGCGLDDVRMIGIKGIGGGGKTTLARAVFDQISYQFEGKSFIENVGEVSNASSFGLRSLQNQVLFDILNNKDSSVSNVYDGKNMLKRMMQDRKVLVVLDDVDHRDQLEALAGEPNWFKHGSRIIITTRDEQVLVAHGVKLIHNVNLLSNKEAIRLFSRYAFGREIPNQRYAELAQKVVHYAAGLPLTITVLGSSLCGQTELQWIDFLERLETIPLEETLKKLELSYISLEEDHKEMFLDVACILKGQHIDYAIRALESCGFHARYGLRVLEQRSLITISKGELLGMHDHIEEMGKNIVRCLHPHNPNKHSRLWIDDEIKHILANDLGTEETRCIRLNQGGLDPEIAMKGLRKMKKLRFLDLTLEAEFTSSSSSDCFCWNSKSKKLSPYFPNGLKCLQCYKYPFRSLPKTFKADNLVTLIMTGSRIVKLWEGSERKVLNNLKYLTVSESRLRTLDLGITPNLEELDLNRCAHLVELHMPVKCLKLRSLTLYASKLTTLDLGLAPNLEKLALDECDDLVQLHMLERCRNLTFLKLTNVKLRTLDLRPTPNLKFLEIRSCDDLEEVHLADVCQKLESLDIIGSKLKTLQLGLALNFKKLTLLQCDDLEELHILGECKKLSTVNISHTKLRTLDLGLAPNLKVIVLECRYLEEFHMADECQNLSFVHINHLKLRTLDLRMAPNLETLTLKECKDLIQLHMPRRCLNLKILNLTKLKLRTLALGSTPNLKFLFLNSCYDLEELHMADECKNLIDLNITHSKLKTLDLGLCLNLQSLGLEGCCHFEKLPEDIGQLQCLERLILRGCSLLQCIPDSIAKVKCLKVLDIRGTCISHLPQSILSFKGLRIYGSPELIRLYGHTSCGHGLWIQIPKYE